MIASKIRKYAAQIISRSIADAADEVQRALGSTSSTASAISLEEMVAHAVTNVPFYRGLGPTELQDMPIVNKAILRERTNDFMAADQAGKKLTSAWTSGSTGTPFQAFFDTGKVARHRGALVGSYRYMGADPFGSFVYARAWVKLSPRRRAGYALRGQFPYAGEQDAASVRAVAEWIRRRQGVTMIGYSSYLERLFRSFEDARVSFPKGTVRAVVGGSEPASGYLAKGAERMFGVTPHMRYSTMELGIVAVTDESLDHYKIDTSSFHVEILKEESDAPAAPGEAGRIVITDLFNRAMPFIRYDTGDTAAFALDRGGRPLPNVLTNLSGRRFDVLVAGTEAAPRRSNGLVIGVEELVDAGAIRQFQLRQNAVGHFTWVLNAEKSESVENGLRGILDEGIGDIRSCRFVYTDEVPAMASGKRQIFVNEIPDVEALLAGSETDGIAPA